MKKLLFLCASALLVTMSSQAQPGQMLNFSENVAGMITNVSMRPNGCSTLVCTTNTVTEVFCYTNCYEKLVCRTNASGQLQCTNVLVCTTRCFTNTFPKITCTNVLSNPTTATIIQSLDGVIGPDGCNGLDGLLPTNLVIHASLYANVRTNDWRGTHYGAFRIVSGTNVVAYGSLTGVNGAGSHRGLEPCAPCNHLEGTLSGQIVLSGPLHGAKIQAAYAGILPNVSCPASNAPQGPVMLGIEGVTVTPCSLSPYGSNPDATASAPTTSSSTAQ